MRKFRIANRYKREAWLRSFILGYLNNTSIYVVTARDTWPTNLKLQLFLLVCVFLKFEVGLILHFGRHGFSNKAGHWLRYPIMLTVFCSFLMLLRSGLPARNRRCGFILPHYSDSNFNLPLRHVYER